MLQQKLHDAKGTPYATLGTAETAQTKPFWQNRAKLDCGHREDNAHDPFKIVHRHAANEMIAEITWDLVMSEDMTFAEGCYRLEGGDWQVVTACKAKGIYPVGIRNGVSWGSGATGMNIVLPDDAHINATVLLEMMSAILGVSEWHGVKGPDSIMLR